MAETNQFRDRENEPIEDINHFCDARYCDVYSHRHINVIDACYETIVELNELKLL